MDWITNQVAIGNFRDAQALPEPVDAILCLKAGCPCESRDDVDAVQVPLIDGAGNTDADIAEATNFIHDIVGAGKRILVHCHAGRSRSVIVVARYLMKAHCITSKEALAMIASRRDICLTGELERFLV